MAKRVNFMLSPYKKNQTNKWEETFQDDKYVYGIDHGDGLTNVHLSQNSSGGIYHICTAFCM